MARAPARLGGWRAALSRQQPPLAGPPARRLCVDCVACGCEKSTATGSAGQRTYNYRGTVFDALGLDNVQVSASRIRQHANPLRLDNQVPVGPLPWSQVFHDPSLPLVVDVGSGSGRFLLLMAKEKGTGQNYLGTDIRGELIRRANEWAQHMGLDKSVHYVKANATVSLGSMLSTYPGEICLIAIQFADPHFKKRHRKRRLVQPPFVKDVAKLLRPGGEVFLQTDVAPLAGYMRDMFESVGAGAFVPSLLHRQRRPDTPPVSSERDPADATDMAEQRSEDLARGTAGAGSNRCEEEAAGAACDMVEEEEEGNEGEGRPCYEWRSLEWLDENPTGVPTERELFSSHAKRRVYRFLLVRQ